MKDEEIVRELYPYVKSISKRLSGRSQDTDDWKQEMLLTMILINRESKLNKEDLLRVIKSSAVNRARDLRRKRRVKEKYHVYLEDIRDIPEEDTTFIAERKDVLDRVFSILSYQSRRIAKLIIRGYTMVEISSLLNISRRRLYYSINEIKGVRKSIPDGF